MTPMNERELGVFRERLAKLAAHGTESAVRAFVDEQFPRLPKDMQDEIVMGLFVTSLEDEVNDVRVAAAVALEEEAKNGSTQA